MTNTSNPYAGLSRKDIKSLLRSNKDDAPKVALLNEAMSAQTQYVAGRLRDTEMSDTVNALKLAAPIIEASPDCEARTAALASVTATLTMLGRFHVSAPPPEKRKRKAVTPEPAPAGAN